MLNAMSTDIKSYYETPP